MAYVWCCCRFNKILCSRSYTQLRAIFEEYNKISKNTIEKAIQKEFSGDIEKGHLAIGMGVVVLLGSCDCMINKERRCSKYLLHSVYCVGIYYASVCAHAHSGHTVVSLSVCLSVYYRDSSSTGEIQV